MTATPPAARAAAHRAALAFRASLGRLGRAVTRVSVGTGVTESNSNGQTSRRHAVQYAGISSMLFRHFPHSSRRDSMTPMENVRPDRDLADRHGRRPRARGGPDPRGHRVRRGAQGVGQEVPGAHQQLDLHPARPARPPARQRDRRARGGDLDLGAGHRRLPRRPAAARHGVRRGRGGPDHRDARHRLRDDRPRSRLRGAGRDPHLLLRGDHPRHPADRRRRPVHRHQPRRERAQRRREAAGLRVGRGPDQYGDRAGSPTSSASPTR